MVMLPEDDNDFVGFDGIDDDTDTENVTDVLDLWANTKGMAYLRNYDDFQNFIMFLNETDGPLNDIEDWIAFFCSYSRHDMILSHEFKVRELLNMVDMDKEPLDYPAIISFNFDNWNAHTDDTDVVTWLKIPLCDIGIRSIETERDDYLVYYTF